MKIIKDNEVKERSNYYLHFNLTKPEGLYTIIIKLMKKARILRKAC